MSNVYSIKIKLANKNNVWDAAWKILYEHREKKQTVKTNSVGSKMRIRRTNDVSNSLAEQMFCIL